MSDSLQVGKIFAALAFMLSGGGFVIGVLISDGLKWKTVLRVMGSIFAMVVLFEITGLMFGSTDSRIATTV
jgi:hypothetical protein